MGTQLKMYTTVSQVLVQTAHLENKSKTQFSIKENTRMLCHVKHDWERLRQNKELQGNFTLSIQYRHTALGGRAWKRSIIWLRIKYNQQKFFYGNQTENNQTEETLRLYNNT